MPITTKGRRLSGFGCRNAGKPGIMGKRREPRVEARLEVRIAGIDAHGRPLLQLATTRNVSRQGALVEDIQGTFKAGEIISVSYKGNKARFRLAWVGATG